METVRQVIDDDPVPPSRLVPRVRARARDDLPQVSLKEPHKRYESAKEFADDLGRYLSGETIKARRRARGNEAQWAKRRPAAATLLMSSLVATLTLVGLGLWYVQKEKKSVR